MSTAKQTLKYHLEQRIDSLVGDSNTFLWAKSVGDGSFFKQEGVGGGNFLMTLGEFACLNLISKIYWIISRKPEEYPFIDKETKEKFKRQKIEIKESLENDHYELFF